eukprot:jgi/Bigna1/80002/fgenesh1_pg.67_\
MIYLEEQNNGTTITTMVEENEKEDNTCIQAVIRIRPLLKFEVDRGARSVVQSSDKSRLSVTICRLCCKDNVRARISPMMLKPKKVAIDSKSFTYDGVFAEKARQEDVYRQASPVVKSFLEGYNGTIIAYGQTGSGKTYTMGTSASSSSNGVIPKACQEVFDTVTNKLNKTCELQATFVEIYNEQIQDLLHKSEAIEHIRCAHKRTVKSPEEVMKCLEEGSHSRATGSTKMNKESSRSHAIFTLWLTQKPKQEENDAEQGDNEFEADEILSSKFHFVDLAGSERLKKTGAEGQQVKEGIQINKGLFALSQVITALSQKKPHVPFRDSIITRLLQDSLGGNARTVLIACVSPADDNKDESIQTLRYASQVRNIKNKPTLNFSINDAKVKRYRLRIQELEEENKALKDYKIKYLAAMREIKVYKELWISPRGTTITVKNDNDDIKVGGEGSSKISKESEDMFIDDGPFKKKKAVVIKEQQQEDNNNSVDNLVHEMAKDDHHHNEFVERSKRQMANLTQLLVKKEGEIERLHSELKCIENQKVEVEELLHDYQKQVKEKESEFRKLEKTGKNPRHQQRLTQLSNQLKTLRKKLKAEEARRNNLIRAESRLRNLKQEVSRAKKEKARVQKEMKDREKMYREHSKKKELRLTRMMKQKRRTELEKRKLLQKLSKQSSVSRQKDTQIQILKNKVKKMQPKARSRTTIGSRRKAGSSSSSSSYSSSRFLTSRSLTRSVERRNHSSSSRKRGSLSRGGSSESSAASHNNNRANNKYNPSPKYRKTKVPSDFGFVDGEVFFASEGKEPCGGGGGGQNHKSTNNNLSTQRRSSLQPLSSLKAPNGGAARRVSVYEDASRFGIQKRQLITLERRNVELDKENRKLQNEKGEIKVKSRNAISKLRDENTSLKKKSRNKINS